MLKQCINLAGLQDSMPLTYVITLPTAHFPNFSAHGKSNYLAVCIAVQVPMESSDVISAEAMI